MYTVFFTLLIYMDTVSMLLLPGGGGGSVRVYITAVD